MRNIDRVSTIIPTFNRAVLVTDAIRSALAAIEEGDEILVIDDGSTDDTESEVRSFGEPVRYHRILNSGPGCARNIGIGLAKHDLLAFLDSDDRFYPQKLQLQRQVMTRFPELVFCFGNISHLGTDGVVKTDCLAAFQTDEYVGAPFPTKHAREILGPAVPFSTFGNLPDGIADFNIHIGSFGDELMEAYYVHSDAVLIRRSNAGNSCAYPEDSRLMEDWEFFIALARLGPVAFLDRDVAIQVGHDDARLVYVDRIHQLNARLRVLERGWGKSRASIDRDWKHYDALVRHCVIERGKCQLGKLRIREARSDFDAAKAPLQYRLLTRLPEFVSIPLYRAQRSIKKLASASVDTASPQRPGSADSK